MRLYLFDVYLMPGGKFVGRACAPNAGMAMLGYPQPPPDGHVYRAEAVSEPGAYETAIAAYEAPGSLEVESAEAVYHRAEAVRGLRNAMREIVGGRKPDESAG